MAEEIVTSPEESVSMEAPIVEAPVDIQEDVVDVEPTPTANAKGIENFKKLHKILAADEVYSQITPADFNQFLSKYSDITKLQKLHKIIAADEVYGQIMPSDINEAADKYGFGGLGKPSAVPSPSVDGGSATKGRGVEQPSTLPQRSSEASLDNIERTMKVYADGQGAFPETLSAADVKELRKQVPGGELPNVSDEKVAKMLAGKSPKQVRIASVNAITDIKERKTEQARMYLDFSREKSAENQQLDQNITALKEGMEQIKSEGINVYQQLQNPNIDPQTAAMLNEQLQQTQANYNQAANDYNSELEKYQQNARFIKTMGAGGLSNLKGLVPSSMFQPRSPSDVMAASAFNSTAPALLKTLGAVVDIFPSMVYGEDAKDSNSPVADALFNIADKITIDIGKYNPQANVSLMDDVNAANASQLFGSLLGSVAMTFGGGAVAGATGSQVAGFSQVYGDVYKQGRDAGLTQAESMYFALPTGLVAAYFGDKGVESLAGVFSKTSIKSAIKQGMKEMAEKKTPQMMMEFGQQVLTNTLKGSVKEGLQEGSEFVTEFGSKKGASLKEGVKFQDDLSLEGFKKGLGESVIGGAAGGGLLGPFFGAGRNRAFSDVVNKAARDPQAEVDFMNQLDASVGANDITPEQKQQMVEMLEKTKQAAATVPPVVESEPARAEATALVLEQQDLQEQIEQTNPAMAKPLNDRLDEVNNRLGEIAEGKNLPTEPTEEAQQAEATPEENVGDVKFTINGKRRIEELRNGLVRSIEYWKEEIKNNKPKTIFGKLEDKLDRAIQPKRSSLVYEKYLEEAENDLIAFDANPLEYYKKKIEEEPENNYNKEDKEFLEQERITPDNIWEYAGDPLEERRKTAERSLKDYDEGGLFYDNAISTLDRIKNDPIGFLKTEIEYYSQKTPGMWSQEELDAIVNDLNTKIKLLEQEASTGQEAPQAAPQFEAPTIEAPTQEKEAAPQTLPEVENAIADLREQEQAENEETYNKYDEAITPLLKQAKADIEARREEALQQEPIRTDNGYERTFNYGEENEYTIVGESSQDYYDKINAKYDAEVDALNKPTTESQAPVAEEAKGEAVPTSKQAPQAFPAQEGATAEQEQQFKANPELEQIYRDLNAAVNKNLDPKTLEAVKRNPTLVMVEKALRELERKGIIKIDCK
jgi:hypothetical protein